MFLPAAVSVSMYFERRRALANGIAFCGSGLGTFFMAPLIHYLIDCYSWDKTMVILGAIVLLCAPLGALFKSVPRNSSAGSTEVRPKETNIVRENTIGEDTNVKHSLSIGCGCHTFPADILGKMIDVSLIGNGIFKIFALCSLLISIGMYVSYVYTEVRKHINRLLTSPLSHS